MNENEIYLVKENNFDNTLCGEKDSIRNLF